MSASDPLVVPVVLGSRSATAAVAVGAEACVVPSGAADSLGIDSLVALLMLTEAFPRSSSRSTTLSGNMTGCPQL